MRSLAAAEEAVREAVREAAAAAEEEEEWRQWRRGPVRGEPRRGDGEGPRVTGLADGRGRTGRWPAEQLGGAEERSGGGGGRGARNWGASLRGTVPAFVPPSPAAATSAAPARRRLLLAARPGLMASPFGLCRL